MPTAANTTYEPPPIPHEFQFAEPVILVTHGRGREVYASSMELFKRLKSLDTTIDRILQFRHAGRVLTETSVDTLNAFLALPKAWDYFRRRAIGQINVGVLGDKHTFEALREYLGWEWMHT